MNVQKWDVSEYGGQFGLAFITFLYVDILDATGTLYSMARFAGAIDEETQDFENSAVAYSIDALGISIGSLFGCSPVTAYIESGAGISEGGKSGLTSMFTGLAFFIAIFFAPIFASIPPWATGPVLVIVGSLMTKSARDINWDYLGDAIPAFITIAVMPFTYSIAYGVSFPIITCGVALKATPNLFHSMLTKRKLIGGICSYMLINTVVWIIEKASKGKIVPPEKHLKDPWTYKIPGGILPPYVQRLISGKKDFWRDYDHSEGKPVDHVDEKTVDSSRGSGENATEKMMEANKEVPGIMKSKPTSTPSEVPLKHD